MSEHENKDLELEETKSSDAAESVAEAPAKTPAKSGSSKKNKQPEKRKGGRGPMRYLREMRSELKKVVWPSKKQTLNNTGIVIVVVLVVGVFVWIFDGIAGSLIGALIKLFGA